MNNLFLKNYQIEKYVDASTGDRYFFGLGFLRKNM
jgi:hypothetical protein